MRVLNERNSKNNVQTKPPVSNSNGTSENNVVSDQQDSTSINEPVDITKVLKPIPMDESTDSNENEEEIKEAYACFDTEDFKTGYQAFLNKKKPNFKGR